MESGTPPPSTVEEFQIRQDKEQLNLLGILWKVYSGLALLGVCFGGFYIFIGATMGAAVSPSSSSNVSTSDPQMLTAIFSVFGLAICAIAATVSVVAWIVSTKLVSRTSYGLCFAVACVICLNMPLGTALGIFTIVVLNRPSVKATFS